MKRTCAYPLAIAMWDFSWLERRWPGAGYEDWDSILDDLKERGYDAVRIDAYPHLLAVDPDKSWTLKPCWNTEDWGSPALNRVTIRASLLEFMRLCREKGVKVALSTWFREDLDNVRLRIRSPQDHGRIWKTTLDIVADAGLLDENILFIDLNNEFPLTIWAPFLATALGYPDVLRASTDGTRWMKEAIAVVREAYPRLDYCFSVSTEYDTLDQQDVSFMDILEPHVWMIQGNDFYQRVGYNCEQFDSIGYENLVERGEALYRSNPDYWKACLRDNINLVAHWSAKAQKPLITTECWGIVDYKDWPLLSWDWIKELCELGVQEASRTGRWIALATSNFCGPQFVGMWRDVAWHRRLTDIIHSGDIKVE